MTIIIYVINTYIQVDGQMVIYLYRSFTFHLYQYIGIAENNLISFSFLLYMIN